MIVCTVSRVSTYLLNTHIPTLCPGLPPQRASMAQNLRCCAGLDQRPPFDVQFSVRSRARARRSVLLRFSRRQTVLSLLPGRSPEIHINIFSVLWRWHTWYLWCWPPQYSFSLFFGDQAEFFLLTCFLRCEINFAWNLSTLREWKCHRVIDWAWKYLMIRKK